MNCRQQLILFLILIISISFYAKKLQKSKIRLSSKTKVTSLSDIACTDCYPVQSTAWKNFDNNVITFFDNNYLECPLASALNGFRFNTRISNTKYQLSFDYRCIKSAQMDVNTCYTRETNRVSVNGSNIYTITNGNLNFRCNSGYALNRIGFLKTSNNNQIWIEYKCCMINGTQVTSYYKSRLSDNTWNGLYYQNLNDFHALIAPNYNGLTGFNFLNDYGRAQADYNTISVFSPEISSQTYLTATNLNENNNENIFYLDRHNILCNNGYVLSFFHFEAFHSNYTRMRYVFSCIKHRAVTNNCSSDNYTPYNIVNSNHNESMNYLDLHGLDCGNGKAMKGFILQRSGNNIRYNYTCCTVGTKSSYNRQEPYTDSYKWQLKYLDKQYAISLPDQGIRGFRLTTRYYGNSPGPALNVTYVVFTD